jgi:hypothetical protein
VHVDFSVIPALGRFLLSTDARDDGVKLLDIFVESLCAQLDEGEEFSLEP